ncbi:hypothetical protein GOV06_05165, partial [Candidatus Woesearchaeota archaeon]|nr:hypothetical protein [Candidatus Woesearchaeota archaeon]
VYRYDGGTTWTDVGRLGSETVVWSMAVWNGSLYGGTYNSGKVYRYEGGTTWIDLGQLGTTEVIDLAVWNGSLYGATDNGARVFEYGNGTTITAGEVSTGWNHVAVTYTNGTLFLYLNGILNQTSTYQTNLIPSTLKIGTRWGGSVDGVNGELFDGTVDEVRIYNRSLSAEQILALYNNRTDLIVSQETTVGDVWQACITPNDGSWDGDTNCSNNLTILQLDSTPPNITLISPANNTLNTTTNNITLVYNVTDGTGIANCSLILNGAINLTNSSVTNNGVNFFTPTLPDGQYNWSVNCTDSSSNRNEGSSVTYNLTIDATPPESYIITPADQEALGQNAVPYNVTGNASDAYSGVERVELNISGSLVNTTGTTDWNYTWNPTSDGTYILQSIAYDNVGNKETAIEDITVQVFLSSTINNSNATNSTITNSTIDNSTIINSTIDNSNITNSSKIDSTIINSTVTNSVNNNSTIINSNETNSNINDSTIIDSNVTNSTIIDSNITNSTIDNSTITNSTIDNSTIDDSTIDNSTIIDSTIDNSTVIDSNVTDSNITNSTIDDSIIDNSNITDSTINNSNITDSTVIDSTINDSTIDNSDITNSTIINSTKINSTVVDSTVVDSTNYNDSIYNSTEINSDINDSVIINSTVTNSTIDDSTLTNFTSINCTVINSNLTNSFCNNSYIEDSSGDGWWVDPSNITGSICISGPCIVHDSTVAYTNISNSTFDNSHVEYSVVSNSIVNQSDIYHSNTLTIHDLYVANSNITNENVYAGNVTYAGFIYRIPIDLTSPWTLQNIYAKCGDGACVSPNACGNDNNYPICNVDCGTCPSAPAPTAVGRGGGTTICGEEWNCTEWSPCLPNGTQWRTCWDLNRCDDLYNQRIITNVQEFIKPEENRSCEYYLGCQDGILDYDETDIDCGGPGCKPCGDGKQCMSDSDCINSCNATSGLCYTPGPEVEMPLTYKTILQIITGFLTEKAWPVIREATINTGGFISGTYWPWSKEVISGFWNGINYVTGDFGSFIKDRYIPASIGAIKAAAGFIGDNIGGFLLTILAAGVLILGVYTSRNYERMMFYRKFIAFKRRKRGEGKEKIGAIRNRYGAFKRKLRRREKERIAGKERELRGKRAKQREIEHARQRELEIRAAEERRISRGKEKAFHEQRKGGYKGRLDVFLGNAILKGITPEEAKEALVFEGWPKKFVDKYCDEYFKEHKIPRKKLIKPKKAAVIEEDVIDSQLDKINRELSRLR